MTFSPTAKGARLQPRRLLLHRPDGPAGAATGLTAAVRMENPYCSCRPAGLVRTLRVLTRRGSMSAIKPMSAMTHVRDQMSECSVQIGRYAVRIVLLLPGDGSHRLLSAVTPSLTASSVPRHRLSSRVLLSHRLPSATVFHRLPSATVFHRLPSATVSHRLPSATVSHRLSSLLQSGWTTARCFCLVETWGLYAGGPSPLWTFDWCPDVVIWTVCCTLPSL